MKKTIVIDTDGTLRQFVPALEKIIRRVHPYREIKSISRYSLLNSFGFKSLDEFNKFVYRDYCEELFLFAEPYPNAIAFVNTLYESEQFEVTLSSSQPTFDAVKYTIEWYERMGLKFTEFVFLREKALINMDILVDDSEHQILAALQSNIERESPKTIFCLRQSWNKDIMKKIKDFPNKNIVKIIDELNSKLIEILS